MSEASRGHERVGTTIRGKYRIERVLGEGGMAIVYAATHRNQKRFAVKMLHPELSIHQDLRTRFLKEGYAANTVDHPGAVSVLDDDIAEDGSAFLVLELLDGAPVDALFERAGGRLPVPIVLAISHQLLDVLEAAHRKGIVHRDVKPGNVFVTKDGTVKVLDFGIARVRDGAQGGASATNTGVMMGTPAYLPPEQAMAKQSEIDARTDVWAVGAMAFALLSGQIVHEGDNPTQIVIAAATKRARSLAVVAPDVPREVVALVDRALAFEKADRWASAAEMRDAVAAVYSQLSGEPISRAPLALLFGRPSAPPVAPAVGPGTAPRREAVAPPHVAAAASGATGTLALAGAPLRGTTTNQPVVSPLPAAAPRTRAPIFAALVVSGVVALTAGGYALTRGRTAATVSPASSAPPPAAAPPPSARLDAPIASEPVASAPPLVSAPVHKPPPTLRVDRPGVVASATPASSKPATVLVKPSCDPPYFLDGTGKHYKPECVN